MKKFKKIFSALLLSFIFLGTCAAGFLFGSQNKNEYSSADFAQYDTITNDLPDYVKITTGENVGHVGNTTYLFQTGSNVNLEIGDNEIPEGNNKNYAFVPDETNLEEYYYFDFQNSLSLYYNLTNEQIESGAQGVNLMQGKSITAYAKAHENAVTPLNYNFTPLKLDIKFALNTALGNEDFNNEIVTLSNEGCYTLVIPMIAYYTDNGGATFTSIERRVYYTFMVFNASTYFDGAGYQNLTPSANLQQSPVSSTTFSRYYFYNYAYAGEVNTLPSITYNPSVYQISINHTDADEQTFYSTLEYSSMPQPNVVQKDANGNEIEENDLFIVTRTSGGMVTVYFKNIGTYDISFTYLYKATFGQDEETYVLPLENLEGNNNFKNKNQRLYIYGYQAKFSDYSTINEQTNQPEAVEFKSYDFDNGTYELSADITSQFNNHYKNELNLNAKIPSSTSAYELSELKDKVLNFINEQNITPVSTNQTPIKFINNVNLQTENSFIYNVEPDKRFVEATSFKNGTTYYIYDNGVYSVANPQPTQDNFAEGTYYIQYTTKKLDQGTSFGGFNQNDAGTYVYIIQYKYDAFLSESGTSQASHFHYQIFYFTVTSQTPKVTILDEKYEDVYTSTYTNRSVYILNDSENNVYDAKVDIYVSAKNYNTGDYYFNNINIKRLSGIGIAYQKFEAIDTTTLEDTDLTNAQQYNANIAGKYGIFIDKTMPYANANYTIKIYSTNTKNPSIKTFTIDTNEISGVNARNVTATSSTTYKIGSTLDSYNTNCPIIFSWDNKKSGAATYGYLRFIPLEQTEYYNVQSDNERSLLLYYLVESDTLPVAYKLDLTKISSTWNRYTNTKDFSETVNASYVRSDDGFYILEVCDDAGNSTFDIFLLEKTSPVFVYNSVTTSDDFRRLMQSSEMIAVPEEDTSISIEWAKNKAIYLDNFENTQINGLSAYQYSKDADLASAKLRASLNEFFDVNTNANLKTYDNLAGFDKAGLTYNGTYLTIAIDNSAFIKSANPAEAALENGGFVNASKYEITFIDENDTAIEGSYRIYLRDDSNNKLLDEEESIRFKNASSGYVSFVVTSDKSKMLIKYTSDEAYLDFANFSLTGSLYKNTYVATNVSDQDQLDNGVYYTFATTEDSTPVANKLYYKKASDNKYVEEVNLTEFDGATYYEKTKATEYNAGSRYFVADKTNGETYSYTGDEEEKLGIAYKFAYYTPINTKNQITLSFTPHPQGKDELIDTIVLKYYPFEKTSTNGYYTIGKNVERTINIYPTSSVVAEGEEVLFPISFGGDNLPKPGKYVIERNYKQNVQVDQYDYFRRTITFIVDEFGLITPLETISVDDQSSLASIVGRDIALSFYNDNNAIEISFPELLANSLIQGSLYTKDSFDANDENPAIAVEGNKLPLKLFIPQYKFTMGPGKQVSQYNVNYQNILSRYGNAQVIDGDVYVEGIKVSNVNSIQSYLRRASIQAYEIYARITVLKSNNQNKNEVVARYVSNGTTSNGYLNFYPADERFVATSNEPAQSFSQPGDYFVTLYQDNVVGSESKFYSFYKFGFRILENEPSFDILNEDGYTLKGPSNNEFYTNSKVVRIQWQDPQNKYQAKIDENEIYISGQKFTGTINESGNLKYFDYDCSNLIENQGQITVQMQYEGFNSSYYNKVVKTIHFDISAPIKNLQSLMTLTENATENIFTKAYQQINMRTYKDYKNEDVQATAKTNFDNNFKLSYSYSVETSTFKYFSYNVTRNYFNTTLKSTYDNRTQRPNDTQFIYFREIQLNNYQQVKKDSFSKNNYQSMEQFNENRIIDGSYYEIVELDYADNMVVYVVRVINDTANNAAISYTNNNLQLKTEDEKYVNIYDSEIYNGYNLYSTSGLTLKNTENNYMSDPWQLYTFTRYGSTSVRYMHSPWLENNQIYRISLPSLQASIVNMSDIFSEVSSSGNKHSLVMTDRTTGTSKNIYISVMDANLTTRKVNDALVINVPSQDQVTSTTTTYVYPVRIVIEKAEGSNWAPIMDASQVTYGTWTPTTEYADNLSYITFDQTSSDLTVKVNVGNTSDKFKYTITDNFGKTSTVILLVGEVEYNEITGSNIYSLTESNGDITYISRNAINFSYNTLLYDVELYDKDNNLVTTITPQIDSRTKITSYTFAPTGENYDDLYKIVVKAIEDSVVIKTLRVRLYHKLPFYTATRDDISNGGILFADKNNDAINSASNIPSKTVIYEGKEYTSQAKNITTYSQNVTLFYPNGDFGRESINRYDDQYGFTVFLSRDNGLTWENINSVNSDASGYTISGTGEYIVFIKYNTDEIFNEVFSIYDLTILDSSASFYYITVDGVRIEKSDMKYVDLNNVTYETNYIVGIDYDDKSRLEIVCNQELGVEISSPKLESTGTNVFVEIYKYSCDISEGYFTIIYINVNPNDSIVSLFTYETSSGATNSLKSSTSEFVVANKETESNFDKIKLNFTSYYGIKQNKIVIGVQKLFEGEFVDIYPTVYDNGDTSYVYLTRAGSYRLRLTDSCKPEPHVQYFKTSDYVDLVFLNSTPITVTYVNTDGDEVTTEFVQKAVYNSSVKISLNNLTTYYQPSGYPVIKVTKNGVEYGKGTGGYTESNNQYTFTEPGYYSVTFSATSTTGIPIREDAFNFTIINKNESRYAYEFTNYNKYYVVKVVKDDVDITDELREISNFDVITVNNKQYMTQLLINFLDEKTGGGRYRVSISPNDESYVNTIGETFTFDFWINMANPPIKVSLAEGEKTSGNITVTFNTRNLYNAVGDCYLIVGGTTKYYTSENIASYGEIETITLASTGTYFIQLYTSGGHLLYSYKVTKTEPLNAFAIIAIVIAVAVAGAIVFITIRLRKRQKTK